MSNLPQDHDLTNIDHKDFFTKYGYPMDPPSTPVASADPNPGGAIPNYPDVPGLPQGVNPGGNS